MLREEELAMKLGGSRAPHREALHSLEEAKLADSARTPASSLARSTSLRRELYVARRGIDEMIGQMIAPGINEAEIAELRGMVDDMEASFVAQDIREYFPRDMAFHDRIAELTKTQN